jgi:hypothetical protein
MAVSPSPLSFRLDAENFNRFLEEREEIGRWYKSRLLGVWKLGMSYGCEDSM